MNENKLKDLRASKGLLQKELGFLLDIAPSTIGMYEQGRREPDYQTLKKLANFFDVSTDYLLDNEDRKYKNEKELKEKEVLKKILVKAKFMNEEDILTDNDIKNIIKFINQNKDFIKRNN